MLVYSRTLYAIQGTQVGNRLSARAATPPLDKIPLILQYRRNFLTKDLILKSLSPWKVINLCEIVFFYKK